MRIAITGATGSLGKALIERLLIEGIGPIVALGRDELKVERLAQKYNSPHGDVRPMVADIRDERRMAECIRGCDAVINCAALKRIGQGVYSAGEMVQTNINGTLAVIRAATEVGAGKVIQISSDKACQATNLYGGTKFVGEALAVAYNEHAYPKGTRISVCRYGNVLGSRGSVVYIWRNQIRQGKLIQVTHPEMTRYILTLQQAAEFVLGCLQLMRGGEIFVPHLPSAKMTDLAMAVLHETANEVSGFDITGLRPGGEKLHESLLSEEEPRRTVERPGYYVVMPAHRMWSSEPYPGTPVPDDLIYRSDMNTAWLNQSDLEEMLSGVEEEP